MTTTVPVGGSPVGVAVGGGSVWVANSRDGTVTRIDAATAKPVKTIEVGGSPQAVAVADGKVWVTVQNAVRRLPGAGAAAGTLRVTLKDDVDFMDPALAYSSQAWELLYATCAKLLNYPDKAAPAGSQLVPEVAQLATRALSGRQDVHVHDPQRLPLLAALERAGHGPDVQVHDRAQPEPEAERPGADQGYLGQVVGAKAYMAGKARHISGIVAKGDRLTLRLAAPAPELATLIALPFFCAVPVGTPIDPNGVRNVPSAGPYYVAAMLPGRGSS